MSRKQYWTCPYCHSNLDYGEKCDCREREEEIRKEAEEIMNLLKTEKSGQMVMAL